MRRLLVQADAGCSGGLLSFLPTSVASLVCLLWMADALGSLFLNFKKLIDFIF